MEDGDTEKYHPRSVIQDFVFLSRKRGCIRCLSLQVPHLTLDTWERDKSTRKCHIQKHLEVSPFPAGEHKAAKHRQGNMPKTDTNKKEIHKRSQGRTHVYA